MATQTDLFESALKGTTRGNLASIIDRLAGDKDNLRVDLRHVRFLLRGERFDVSGVVDFKVIHEIPDAHAVVKREVEKFG